MKEEAQKPVYFGDEEWWVDHQPFILGQGYKLRPRYDPNWIPSWTLEKDPGEEYEDSIPSYINTPALDAVRLSDGKKVVLKRVPSQGPEIQIVKFLTSLRSEPRNRTIPILDIIPMARENWTLLVMPYCREFDHPPFHCPAEFVEAMQQYLEGLQFMHDHNISHFDIAPQNMMMDETRVVPTGSHFCRPRTHSGFPHSFKWTNRCSVGPVDYYYIDFGLSMHFPAGQATASTVGTLRTFPNIPELSDTKSYNPFKVDVYQLGLTIQKLIENYPSLAAFRPVSAGMLNTNPKARPTPAESLAQLNSIAARMSSRALSASMWEKGRLLNHLARKLVGGR